MSVSDPGVIDFIGTDTGTGDVVLTIADHLDWTDTPGHLVALQDKVNAYLRFIESGELTQKYPIAQGRKPIIQISAKFHPPEEAQMFLSQVEQALAAAGIRLRAMVLDPDTSDERGRALQN
jgi:hypothetical protein